MSLTVIQHPQVPYYDFSVNEGTSGSIDGLTFSAPNGYDGVEIAQAQRDALIAAITETLLGFTGVTSVKVELISHTTMDVTPA